MATGAQSGTNYTALAAATPATLLDYGKALGKLAFTYDTLTATQQYDAASIFTMGAKIPIEAVPLFGFVNFTGSSTATLSLGIAGGDTDLLGTATALATTKRQTIWPTVPNTPLTAALTVSVLTAAAAILTDEVLEVIIVYALP